VSRGTVKSEKPWKLINRMNRYRQGKRLSAGGGEETVKKKRAGEYGSPRRGIPITGAPTGGQPQ